MKIALIGYGRMGKEIERLAREGGDSIVAVFHSSRPLEGAVLEGVDVCIDFSVSSAAVENMKTAAKECTDIVQGTTGWYDSFEEVKGCFRESGLFFAQNFSVGMNMFYRITQTAATLVNNEEEYDPYILEHHNRDKEDHPSGTGLRLGEIVLGEIRRKLRIQTDPTGGISPESLHVASIRAGNVPASHTVAFESDFDTIELRHISKNRIGFALGALKAAHWLHGRKGVYTVDDLDL